MNLVVTERTSEARARRIPIRELQQHAARVIKELAEADEVAEITSRGEVVARLIPVSPAERAFAQMIERGEIIPAKNPGGLADWQPLPQRPGGGTLAEELIEFREEEG